MTEDQEEALNAFRRLDQRCLSFHHIRTMVGLVDELLAAPQVKAETVDLETLHDALFIKKDDATFLFDPANAKIYEAAMQYYNITRKTK